MIGPDDVLRFWFGDSGDEGGTIAQGRPRWFNGGEALDREIGARFGAWVEAARRGELSYWAGEAHGRLALLILIDQFGRNLHRGNGAAFAADALAQALCLEGLRLGHDRQLSRPQRVFFYLPLEHAENLSLQDCSVALFAALRDEAPEALRSHYESFLDYAVRHREVIARFGRFPHRNAVLGRTNTPDEETYLAQPGAGF
ncbi:DUF924 family protein [Rehaibacterium terrae]|jgi:uncharacterized protein (DUF924 family)|uniref:Uncharacterized protein (DUF924 family) n=1 Tax=Rehaibacterium terrae TaxID=1341696 RepID=A0A7W8DFN0_9GAMM|nr:DUF924 family protein [Rehaibacterium terrae]MBB5016369.1 uncharacterized protein (DUF924 family) [Rehaibacterium terrae]